MIYLLKYLPTEIHYEIAKYLTVVEFYYLSQTSKSLRRVYHPLVYQKCILYPSSDIITISTAEWAIPIPVFCFPSNYSWFCKEAVKVIALKDQKHWKEIVDYISSLDYPNLKSVVLKKNSDSRFQGNCDDCFDLCTAAEIGEAHLIRVPDLFPIFQNASRVYNILSDEPLARGDIISKVLLEQWVYLEEIIESLELDLTCLVAYSNRSRQYVAQLTFDSFPNLRKVSIISDCSTPVDSFATMIQSLPRCEKLEKLEIFHMDTNTTLEHFETFDNLIGPWKSFVLKIICKPVIPFTVRLPTVTTLEMSSDSRSFRLLEPGPRIKNLVVQFTHRENPFNRSNIQGVLDNLTLLSIQIPINVLITEGCDRLQFLKKELPNLKVLDVGLGQMTFYKDLSPDIAIYFKHFMDTAKFGEFDMLDLNHMEPLLELIYHQFLERLSKYSDSELLSLTDVMDTVTEAIKGSILDSSFVEVCRHLFRLQFVSFATYGKKVNEKCHSCCRTYASILFDRTLKYLPNLEIFNISALSSIEEFPTLHKLIRRHTRLSKIYIHNMRFPMVDFAETNDIFYNQFKKFVIPFFYYEEDLTQYYGSAPSKRRNIDVLIDMEAIHRKYHKRTEYFSFAKTNGYTLENQNTKRYFRFNPPYLMSDRFLPFINILC